MCVCKLLVPFLSFRLLLYLQSERKHSCWVFFPFFVFVEAAKDDDRIRHPSLLEFLFLSFFWHRLSLLVFLVFLVSHSDFPKKFRPARKQTRSETQTKTSSLGSRHGGCFEHGFLIGWLTACQCECVCVSLCVFMIQQTFP